VLWIGNLLMRLWIRIDTNTSTIGAKILRDREKLNGFEATAASNKLAIFCCVFFLNKGADVPIRYL
jgi:hypothetical protein